jgi:hypothetical protein
MSKPWTPKRQTVELQPSRIRRDPPGVQAKKAVAAYPTEREIWTVAIGVVLFAVAITLIAVGFSNAIN